MKSNILLSICQSSLSKFSFGFCFGHLFFFRCFPCSSPSSRALTYKLHLQLVADCFLDNSARMHTSRVLEDRKKKPGVFPSLTFSNSCCIILQFQLPTPSCSPWRQVPSRNLQCTFCFHWRHHLLSFFNIVSSFCPFSPQGGSNFLQTLYSGLLLLSMFTFLALLNTIITNFQYLILSIELPATVCLLAQTLMNTVLNSGGRKEVLNSILITLNTINIQSKIQTFLACLDIINQLQL